MCYYNDSIENNLKRIPMEEDEFAEETVKTKASPQFNARIDEELKHIHLQSTLLKII